MLTGAFATNVYSVPRSTRDVDLVLDVSNVKELSGIAVFSSAPAKIILTWFSSAVITLCWLNRARV